MLWLLDLTKDIFESESVESTKDSIDKGGKGWAGVGDAKVARVAIKVKKSGQE